MISMRCVTLRHVMYACVNILPFKFSMANAYFFFCLNRKWSDLGVSDDVQLGGSDDMIPFTEAVSHIGQAKWKDMCFTLGFEWCELDEREKNRPFDTGKEKLLHFLHEVISDKGYSEARKKIIAACKKAKLRGALIDTLAKNGLTL
eukprot:m.101206 g.101206  ORF g.101206 m.101206 type:complete len:146 (+) comp37123_c0_seq8:359-796(+)